MNFFPLGAWQTTQALFMGRMQPTGHRLPNPYPTITQNFQESIQGKKGARKKQCTTMTGLELVTTVENQVYFGRAD